MAYDVAAAEAYIRQAAIRRGQDPNTAVRVARSEGLADGVYQSNVMKNGMREPSYGPFQLLVGDGKNFPKGMGNDFIAKTGLDPRDPSTVNAQIDFALDNAQTRGWTPWYGAKAVGISAREGLPGGSAPQPRTGGYSGIQTNDAGQVTSIGAPVQPIVQQGATPTNYPAPPPDPNRGAGLIAMMQDENPMSLQKAKTFLGAGAGGANPIAGSATGLALLAQGLGEGQGNQAPQIQAPPIEDNRPDMSLLQMLMSKRQKAGMNV